MKWINKGHEFDGISYKMKKIKKLYIFGAGLYGKCSFDLLKNDFEIIAFVDNDKNKQNTIYLGYKVISKEEIILDENTAIIVAAGSEHIDTIINSIKSEEIIENENIFSMNTFVPIYYVYYKDKVIIPSISFLPSTKCNLRCEACLNFTTHNKKMSERNIEEIKKDIDLFFMHVDYIILFHISGGEPMLYSKIDELIEYIGENYIDKIHRFATTTNGTILPSEKTCKLLNKYRVNVALDDYRVGLGPNSNKRFKEVIEKFDLYNVPYYINYVEDWIDLAPFNTDHSKWTDKELANFFDLCSVPWQEFRNGKFYSCNYASYAVVANLIDESDDDTYCVEKLEHEQKKELVEFRLGYNNKGYVEFCKRCSGYIGVNKNIVPVAKQCKVKD